MRPQIIASTLALAALLSLGACNKPAAAPGADSAAAPVTAAATNVLDCEGPFGPDASKASLSEFFGAANVVDMNVDGPEGTTNSATVLFPNDPARRVEVLWQDEQARQQPSNIEIKGASSWVGPKGLKIGSSLEDVEKANGKPFKMSGFGWDYGGYVTDWGGGAFAPKDDVDNACIVMINFNTSDGAPTEKVQGDKSFDSSDPAMRAAKPTIYSIAVGYRSPND